MENNKYITNEYLKQTGVNDPKKGKRLFSNY